MLSRPSSMRAGTSPLLPFAMFVEDLAPVVRRDGPLACSAPGNARNLALPRRLGIVAPAAAADQERLVPALPEAVGAGGLVELRRPSHACPSATPPTAGCRSMLSARSALAAARASSRPGVSPRAERARNRAGGASGSAASSSKEGMSGLPLSGAAVPFGAFIHQRGANQFQHWKGEPLRRSTVTPANRVRHATYMTRLFARLAELSLGR